MLIDGTIESGKLLDELRLAHPEAGAVVCFTGQVRGANETDPVKALYLCLLYTSPSPRDKRQSRMPSSA